MDKKEQIVKAEYEQIIEIWRFEHKWLDKSPLKDEDWGKMVAEANEIAKKRKGKWQEILAKMLNAVMEEIELVNKEALK